MCGLLEVEIRLERACEMNYTQLSPRRQLFGKNSSHSQYGRMAGAVRIRGKRIKNAQSHFPERVTISGRDQAV
jgi:hypothetical protein